VVPLTASVTSAQELIGSPRYRRTSTPKAVTCALVKRRRFCRRSVAATISNGPARSRHGTDPVVADHGTDPGHEARSGNHVCRPSGEICPLPRGQPRGAEARHHSRGNRRQPPPRSPGFFSFSVMN
jgi:hypothetical protein